MHSRISNFFAENCHFRSHFVVPASMNSDRKNVHAKINLKNFEQKINRRSIRLRANHRGLLCEQFVCDWEAKMCGINTEYKKVVYNFKLVRFVACFLPFSSALNMWANFKELRIRHLKFQCYPICGNAKLRIAGLIIWLTDWINSYSFDYPVETPKICTKFSGRAIHQHRRNARESEREKVNFSTAWRFSRIVER